MNIVSIWSSGKKNSPYTRTGNEEIESALCGRGGGARERRYR